MADVTVREFQPGDEAVFRHLNEAWIRRYFVLEPKDEATLSDPRSLILQPGGKIVFVMRDGETVGCCALLAIAPGEFELGKMAVAESHLGTGMGRYLLEQAISIARAAGATRLYLETNRTLVPAVRLYESAGFKHLPPERIVPSPYARANVYMELIL